MLSVGASPDDVGRLTAMLRAVARFGHDLGRICDDCAEVLEELTPPVGENAEDTAAEQRADDDGMPPAG